MEPQGPNKRTVVVEPFSVDAKRGKGASRKQVQCDPTLRRRGEATHIPLTLRSKMNRSAIVAEENRAAHHDQRIARASSTIDNKAPRATSSATRPKQRKHPMSAQPSKRTSNRPGSAQQHYGYDSEGSCDEAEEAPALSSQVGEYCRGPESRPSSAPPVRVATSLNFNPQSPIIDEDDEEDTINEFSPCSSADVSRSSRPPLPIGRVGRISGPATCADGALLTAPLNCDVGPIIGGLDGLRLDNIREDEDSQSELDECAEESPAEPEQIQPALESNAEESDRQLYLPRPRSAPSARPGSASSTSGSSRTVARPLSAPKWGERLPSDCSMEGGRPSSAPQGRRQPISIESLQALAGLTDDLLGIVPDEGDEKNPDDLDLVESPRLEDYDCTSRRLIDDIDDSDDDNDDAYIMRSIDIAMSRGTDAAHDSARPRVQPVSHETQFHVAHHALARQAIEERPKSALVTRPRSGTKREIVKGSKSKRTDGRNTCTKSGSGKQPGRTMKDMKHKDIVAEALAKDPKRLSRGIPHRPSSATQRESMYLGTVSEQG